MLFGQRLFMCSFLPKVGSRSKSSCRELANEPNHEFGRAVWKQNITVALTSFEVSDAVILPTGKERPGMVIFPLFEARSPNGTEVENAVL